MGWFLDHKVFAGKTAPLLTFSFLALGIVAGFKGLWDLTRKIKDGESDRGCTHTLRISRGLRFVGVLVFSLGLTLVLAW